MKNNNALIKYKIFIAPVVLMIVFAVGVAFVLKVSIKKLDDNSNVLQKKIVEMEIEMDKINELPKLKEQFMQFDENRSKLDVLFSESDIVVLVQELERIAEDTGNVISISVEENKGLTDKTKASKNESVESEVELLDGFTEDDYFKIDISVSSDYNGLIKFIDRLSGLKYYNSLVYFNIASSEKSRASGTRSENVGMISGANLNSGQKNSDTVELILETELSVVFYLNNKDKNES